MPVGVTARKEKSDGAPTKSIQIHMQSITNNYIHTDDSVVISEVSEKIQCSGQHNARSIVIDIINYKCGK